MAGFELANIGRTDIRKDIKLKIAKNVSIFPLQRLLLACHSRAIVWKVYAPEFSA
jgi:hypothetical protein